MVKTLELVCERYPKCGYEVASQTPSSGYQFPTKCPRCGGDLVGANKQLS